MADGELSGVSVLLLALLSERPMHPYEAFQTLEERHDDRLVRVNAGAVYHGFERLERDGLARREGTERQGRRPERTTYAITEAGRNALSRRVRSLLADEHPAHPLFAVGLAEAECLPVDQVVVALRERLARDEAYLTHGRVVHERLTAQGLARRHMLELEHELAVLDAQNRWLTGLVEELLDGTLAWNPSPWPAPAAPADDTPVRDGVATPTEPRSAR